MGHDLIVTLDELPAQRPDGHCPQVGILDPRDDGSAWFTRLCLETGIVP